MTKRNAENVCKFFEKHWRNIHIGLSFRSPTLIQLPHQKWAHLVKWFRWYSPPKLRFLTAYISAPNWDRRIWKIHVLGQCELFLTFRSKGQGHRGSYICNFQAFWTRVLYKVQGPKKKCSSALFLYLSIPV